MARDVLLVGSVGLDNADEVFRTVGSILGDAVKRVPDGETGWARSVWIQCQRPFFLSNPALEMVEPDPTNTGAYIPARVPGGRNLRTHDGRDLPWPSASARRREPRDLNFTTLDMPTGRSSRMRCFRV